MLNSKNNNNNNNNNNNQDEDHLNSNIFENLAFVFDKTINLKRKTELIKIIKKNGGKSCYSCTKATHLISTKEGYLEKTQKVEQALSLGIPILVKEFVHDCVLKKELLPDETFLVSSLVSDSSVLSLPQELEVNLNNEDNNTLTSINKVELGDKKTTTTNTTNNSSPSISLIALEDISGNRANTTAQIYQKALEAENQALKERIKEIEHEFKCYINTKENLEMEKDLEINKLLESQRNYSTLKACLLRDLENKCKEVIDLEFILEEYQARNAILTDRLKGSNKPGGNDEEKKVIQTKLDQMTTLKIQLDNENTQLNSEIESLKLNSLRGHHIFGLENNISINQENQSKLPINNQNQTLHNEGIKNDLEGVKSKKSEKLGARILRFFRCGSSNSSSAQVKSNNSNKSTTSYLSSSSSSSNTSTPSYPYNKNNNTSPLVPPPHLPPLPAWRYKYISAVLPTSLTKPSSRVENFFKDESLILSSSPFKQSSNSLIIFYDLGH
ncbi:hypothetical protein DICPUDRAFT_157823 [Dictyostelium purpureum]|uniref:BRCT domain-containing protein n=1 Tax=Dictyostelium purpureum TaxID=5786 RepID=F1A033_DICPU|nr:uncharacterized protein DICPUDRAFT_157823 [Dictyostelium purpureum]EGC30447.1 hypothetical protein DICPUDRAFT_157823 [Dictyostelium purpureum]|eukprot:XP_003293026.1 hypothetical protein DICPUDRAFT_157823 [Dictyostelium purpureum]